MNVSEISNYSAPISVVTTASASSSIVSFMPDWLLFSLTLVALILVYSFVIPEDFKEPVKKFLKSWGIWILAIGIAWYFRDRWGLISDNPTRWPANVHWASFIVGFVIIIYWGASSWLYEQRYRTNHIIADNVSGSCSRQQVLMGTDNIRWVVFFLGTSGTTDDRFAIPWPFTQKLIVAPESCCQTIGNQILVKAQCHKTNYMDCDTNVANFIDNDTFARWCKDDVWLGYAELDVETSNPEYQEILDINKKQKARINELNVMLDGKLGRTKGFISDTVAMQDKLRGEKKFFNRQSNPGGNEE